jgi:hypothetical protein
MDRWAAKVPDCHNVWSAALYWLSRFLCADRPLAVHTTEWQLDPDKPFSHIAFDLGAWLHHPGEANPWATPALSAPPPPQPGAKQPKTYTVTVYNGSQVMQKTFVMGDDGLWHASDDIENDTVTPAAPAAGPMAAPQARSPAQAIPQQAPMPLDPVALKQMGRQNQERVRQQILQTQQQMMQRIGR